MTTRHHIPAPGRCSPMAGAALCGRWATYETGDHDLIVRLARAALAGGRRTEEGWCRACMARLARMGG